MGTRTSLRFQTNTQPYNEKTTGSHGRWLNILIGFEFSAVSIGSSLVPFQNERCSRNSYLHWGLLVYTLVMVAVVALARGWYVYTMYGLIEIILSLLVVWYAWTWPKEACR
jgi:lysylphosphatidylglycerol synthetase-like protein (DUF2156 family)